MVALCPAELARMHFWNEHEFDTSGVEDAHAGYAQQTIKALLARILATDPQYANDGPSCTCETGDVEWGPFIMAAHSPECALLRAPAALGNGTTPAVAEKAPAQE